MAPLKLIALSLLHHWRINIAVALGVAAATAVLTGALLVGDSVRGSLRALTLDRLGAIDEVLVTDRFFRRALADELAVSDTFPAHYNRVVPVVLFPSATLQYQGQESTARASGVLVVGGDADFWELDESSVRPATLPGPGEIVLNQAVADEWGAEIGQEVVVRLPAASEVPADSPLAHKADRIRRGRLRIVDIVPSRGLGRFSLRPSQQVPRNAFVARETLQGILDQPDRVNALLVAGRGGRPPPGAHEQLQTAFRPRLEDFGISIEPVERTFQPPAGQPLVMDRYFSVTIDRMIFAPEAAAAIGRALGDWEGQPLFTYLANRIVPVSTAAGTDAMPEGIPYSTVTAIDPSPAFPLTDLSGRRIESLADDDIVLNSWAANDLGVQLGDKVSLEFFAPETTHGQAVERTAQFLVRAITPLTEPSQPYRVERRRGVVPAVFTQRPTLANDPQLTPTVEGITDQESINQWDPPFPYEPQRIRSQDEDYWYNHRTTPKAFLSLAAGQRIWGSRFGNVTSFRVPWSEGLSAGSISKRILEQFAGDGVTLGMEFQPVKQRQLDASQGTTPFDGLFLGLSFFIIAAALLLVFLLFRLGVEQRAAEVGTLLAVGVSRRRVGRLLVAEGTLVALTGALFGVVIGIGYAWAMLAGLRTWWVGAITTPFLGFHWTPLTLASGYALGVLFSIATIAWSMRRFRHVSVRRLLAGQASDAGGVRFRPRPWLHWLAVAILVVAVGMSGAATQLAGMTQAGVFFGAGAAMLVGLLVLVGVWLRTSGRSEALLGPQALARLAGRNAARNPARSVMTIALMATASFLIVAMSSFRIDPTVSGTGGFQLLAESDDPVFADLGDAAGRQEVLFDQAATLVGSEVFSLRLRAGDDASCNNLYRSQQPRVLGVTPQLIAYFDGENVPSFRWSASEAETDEERENPWRLLERPRDDPDGPVPVIIDMNTALWSLQLYRGTGSVYEAVYDGQLVKFDVVGLLENSVLQGNLLIGEQDFQRLFPDLGGYRYFLIRTPAGKEQQVRSVLEDRLGDQGFDAVSAASVLGQLLAVQNTYLSTFQSLGALGLLLGTFGLAAVQLRSVIERRGELALLRAAGFRRRRLASLVLLENVLLLLIGLGTGCAAALLVVLPHKMMGDAAIPLTLLRDLLMMLAAVLLIGVLSSVMTARAVLRAPLLPALRGD